MRGYKSREIALGKLMERRERGETLAHSVIISPQRQGIYYIPSSSDPRDIYTVDMTQEICNCPDWIHLNTPLNESLGQLSRCKHIWAVVFYKASKD
jgi:hypothetical protein